MKGVQFELGFFPRGYCSTHFGNNSDFVVCACAQKQFILNVLMTNENTA